MSKPNRTIIIFDTTLRDGEQTPGVNMTIEDKLEIARQLARLRVDVIEAGFPITSPGDFEAVRAIASEIRGPVICGLARTNDEDIIKAWEAVKPASPRARIHTFVATSDVHMQYKLKKSPDEVLAMTKAAVTLARRFTPDVEFSAEDATRSDPEFLARVFGVAVESGATTINIPDTVGYTAPREFAELIRFLKARVRGLEGVTLSVHCHDDLGMAVANSLAAIQEGVNQIECTVNGLGERAGNTSLEEVVMALVTRRDLYGCTVRTATEQIYRTSRLVSAITGIPVQPNKAIVGANAFAHQSGIHQDGVLKERTTYEIMKPESIGLSSSRIVLGKVSGRHAFRKKLEEMGYSLNEKELDRLFRQFKALADRKKDISDKDVEALVEEHVFRPREYFRLDYYHVTSGNTTIPTATVRLAMPLEESAPFSEGAAAVAPSSAGRDAADAGEVADDERGAEIAPKAESPATAAREVVVEEAASGDGPVDALFKAIERAAGIKCKLMDYSLKAVTSGKDALGEANLKIERKGKVFAGRGVSVDVIEASARAYVSALNRLYIEGVRPGANGATSEGE